MVKRSRPIPVRMKHLGALAVAGVLAAACSSTVPVGSNTRAGTSNAEFGELGGESFSDVDSGGSVVPGSPGSPGAAAGRRGAASASGATSAVQGATAGKPSCKVKWGALIGEDSPLLRVFVGAEMDKMGEIPSEEEGQARYRRQIDELNKQGGYGGCTIELVFDGYPVSTDPAGEQQASCTTFTEDHQVAVVLTHVRGFMEAFAECVAGRGIPVIYSYSVATAAWANSKKAPIFLPFAFFVERWGPMIDEFAAGNFFKEGGTALTGTTVGLLVRDNPMDISLAEKVWKPRLEALRLPVEIATYSDAGMEEISRSMSNAVLKFRSENVTHVIFGPGDVAFLFMNAAESQGYRPRYGLTSFNNPTFQIPLTNPEQFANSMLIGMYAASDGVPENEMPPNAAYSRCRKLYPPGDDLFGGESSWCDEATFVFEAGKRAPDISPAGLRKGAAALGTTWQSAMLYGGSTAFLNNRLDGGRFVRLMKFDSADRRFKFVNRPPREL